MNDRYISKITVIEDSGGSLHHCGTVSVRVQVECPTAEELMYCPGCNKFWEMAEDYWGDDKTKWAVEKPVPQTNYIELYKTNTIYIDGLREKLKTKDRLLSENHQLIIARAKKIKILEEEQIEYLETHLQVQEQFNEVMAELRQHYGPNNEVLDELENRILSGPGSK